MAKAAIARAAKSRAPVRGKRAATKAQRRLASTVPICPVAPLLARIRELAAAYPSGGGEIAPAVVYEAIDNEMARLAEAAAELTPATADSAVALLEIAIEHCAWAQDEWIREEALCIMRNVAAFLRAVAAVDPRPVIV